MKVSLLRAIDRSRSILPLQVILRTLGLSQSRYHSWKCEEDCSLDDMPSCPRSSPQQLTRTEVKTFKEMVTSEEYRHVPTGTLALLAQRLGKVFASPTTWYRLVRLHKWRRPRLRVHRAKPKVGIRTTVPNELWHVDTTLIRLLDGTRAYLHAVSTISHAAYSRGRCPRRSNQALQPNSFSAPRVAWSTPGSSEDFSP